MKVRMLAVLVGLLALSLVGAFALSFGSGTASAVTGSQITAECHGWPGQSKVHWDAEYWKATQNVTVNYVHMTWNPNSPFPAEKSATIDGETAHHTTPALAHTLVAYVHFSSKIYVSNGYVSGLTAQVTCR